MRLSVVVPTTGRETLRATLASCQAADELVVVHDTACGRTAPSVPYGTVLGTVEGGDHGYTARTAGMKLATGTHLAFLDDDDTYRPGAVDLMRAHATDKPVIFRMQHPVHGVLWREPRLEFGNVGTPMILVPNIPDRLGVWEPHQPGLGEPGGDYMFAKGCVEKMGDPVWRDDVIADIRPPAPRVSVVTPWFEHLELAADYFAAIPDGCETVIVDNGSMPPLPFPAIRLPENTGFCRASNVGLRAAKGEIVVFLNNDIEATDPGWLEELTAAVEPGVLVGARVRFDQHGHVDGRPLPYLDGWCLAGMRADLLELGGFDEGYGEPAYFSDNDLCFRARLAGMRLREVRVGLRHKANKTAGYSERVQAVTDANYKRFAARVRSSMVAA